MIKEKLYIAGIAIIMIAAMISASVYFTRLSHNNDSQLSTYIARRQDLMAQQERLSGMIQDLNATLNQQVAVNQQLTKTLQSLPNATNISIPTPVQRAQPAAAVQPSAPAVKHTTTTQPAPRPAPTPPAPVASPPPRVTRAS